MSVRDYNHGNYPKPLYICNKNVDIKFSAQGAFLEEPSSGMLM